MPSGCSAWAPQPCARMEKQLCWGLCGGLVFTDMFVLASPSSGEPSLTGRNRRAGHLVHSIEAD